MKINCIDLKYYSKMPHLSMIICGFIILKRKGMIKELNVIDATNEENNLDNRMIVEAVVDGKIRIAYDVCDGYINFEKVNEEFASSVDYYFIRSYSEEIKEKFFKNTNMLPLGMNYYCSVKNNPFEEANGLKEEAKKIAKKIMSNFNPQISVVFDVKQYEKTPSYNMVNIPKTMFNTRLWNPQGDVGEAKWERMHPERVHMNKTRVEVIQKAKERYKGYFAGGVYDTKYAREYAPKDVILPNSKTTKKEYLKKMQSYDICIGSEGLHGSIGWKTAEYVAASKAIVMERPKYIAPYFEEGKNYLGFSNTEECIRQLDYLYKNPDKIVEMQKNNKEYYEKYLRPDMQILRTLEIASQGYQKKE